MCRYEETDQGDIDHVLAGRSTKQEDVILKGETFLDGFLFVSLRVCLCAFFSVRVFQCARRVFVWLCVASSHTCVHAHRHAMCTGKLGVMLDGLAATRHKLTSELARIASERARDEAAWRSTVFIDNNATAAREESRLTYLEKDMTEELAEAVTDLERRVSAQTVTTQTSFLHVAQEVTQLAAAQHKENKEQAAWLDTLTLAVHEAGKKMEDDLQQLREQLLEVDTRLTQNTRDLDDLQTDSIVSINHTLVRDLDSVNATAHAMVLRDKLAAQERLTTEFNTLRRRISVLGSAVNTTAAAQRAAVLELQDVAKRQDAMRKSGMAAVERDARSTQKYLDARLVVVHKQIASLKQVRGLVLGRSLGGISVWPCLVRADGQPSSSGCRL